MDTFITFYGRYYANLDYELQHNCNNDCIESGICRCSVITSPVVVSINNYKVYDMVEVLVNKPDLNGTPRCVRYMYSQIEQYCVERIITKHKILDGSLYYVTVERGYYGDEIGDIIHENEQNAMDDILTMISLKTDIEKLHYVLMLEYGYIAPIISECKNLAIKKVCINDIVPTIAYKSMEPQHTYHLDVYDDMIMGVLKGNKLIDGNHRYSFYMNKMKDKNKDNFVYYIELS